MPINIHDPQDSDIIDAFSNWMHKWQKKYPSIDEKHARLDDFKNNILNQPFIPASEPLWDILSQNADHVQKFFQIPDVFRFMLTVKPEDGSLDQYHEEYLRICEMTKTNTLNPLDSLLYQTFCLPKEHYLHVCDEQKEADLRIAFQKWKKTWDKLYPSTKEDKARFQGFKHNVLHQSFMPASDALCYLLSPMADEPRTENFDVLRLDHCKFDDGLDDDLPSGHYIICPDDKEDGTDDIRYLTIEEYWEQRKDDTKEEDQDDATVKHQSTVLPVKRISNDDKDDTVKRQNIGCGGHNPGCCSDCGN